MNLNFPANLGEIVEFPAREVEELAVLVVVGLALGLDELENEGAACADVVAAWEEVSADEGFEDAGLAAALAADDGDLGEVDGGLAFTVYFDWSVEWGLAHSPVPVLCVN